MIRRLLCLIGWHEWVWPTRHREFNYDTPPRNAKCIHCGITFMPWEKEK